MPAKPAWLRWYAPRASRGHPRPPGGIKKFSSTLPRPREQSRFNANTGFRMNKVCLALVVLAGLTGCAGDVLDDIEDQQWDAAAAKVSTYCETVGQGDLWVQRTRIEARREIRQRGRFGPIGPGIIGGLDDKTAFGPGPVLMIWCDGETDGQGNFYPVPDEVWQRMIRDWRD
jgi:hypothetical protein